MGETWKRAAPRGRRWDISRTSPLALVAAGVLHSIYLISFICQLVAKYTPCNVQPGVGAPHRLPDHPPAHVLLSIALAKDHRFGPAPRGND